MSGEPILLMPNPGIERDGTRLGRSSWIDGLWARFSKGKPRKILGCEALSRSLTAPVRSLSAYASGSSSSLHMGSSAGIYSMTVDSAGNVSTPAVRPISSGYTSGVTTLWSLAVAKDPLTSQVTLFANPNKSLVNIADKTNAPIFYGQGDAQSGNMSILTNAPQVSGGVLVVGQFLFAYGNDGLIANSDVNAFNTWTGGLSNSVNPTNQKIIYGAKALNGSGPSALFWSLNALIRMTFSGGSNVFNYSTVTEECSIMSSRCVAEHGGVFMWPGIDVFYQYNGGVTELVNNYNIDWFFKTVDKNQRQKVFSVVVPRWGEVWWCFPSIGSTECDQAIIYNYREGVWYDTKLVGKRSSGLSGNVIGFPIMGGADKNSDQHYNLWQHETGNDIVDGGKTTAIRSYIETNDITMLKSTKPASVGVAVSMIEPDFIQKGLMTATIIGNANSRSDTFTEEPLVFADTASGPEDQVLGTTQDFRQLRVRFENSALGGYWEYGNTYIYISGGSKKITR